MKTLKITLIMLLTAIFFGSCVIAEDDYDNGVSLDELLQSTDLWYIDYNQTTGYGDTRFMSLAFTISFENGKIYANNNLVGIGNVGGGYGDQIGYYTTNGYVLTIDHDLDGYIDFEITQVGNKLKFSDVNNNVTYTLLPYSVNSFDYDKVFYDNIEYFLQEYVAWEKTDTIGGVENAFDNENFLAFIPENVNVFKSSQDLTGTTINNLLWDFEGDYEVFDVQGTNTLKVLTLNYSSNDTEEFELSILNDGKIELYHNNSDTSYIFNGRENIIFKNSSNSEITKTPRKRFKVKRRLKNKKEHITLKSNRK